MVKKTAFSRLILGVLLLLVQVCGQALAETTPPEDSSGATVEQANLPELHLPALIALAIEENPELQAMRKEAEAKKAVIPQAKALLDPMLELRLSNLPADDLSLARDPMSGMEIMLRQAVPYPGKLALRGEIASAEAAMASQEYRDLLYEVVDMVKRAYYELWEAERALEITRLTQTSLQDIVKIAETKYAVGKGLQQDVLKAQVELSRLLDDLLMWQRMREGARAMLNKALGRPPQAPLGPTGKVEKSALTLSLSDLQQKALQARPWLRQSEFAVRRAQANEALARKDLKPDFEFGLGYMIRSTIPGQEMSGTDMVSASVAVNLPIYAARKQRKRIEEAGYDLEAARARQQAAATEIFSRLGDLLAQAERSGRQVDLFRQGIIPQAELAFESARAGYQVGKVDFLDLLDAQVKLYEYQLSYFRALAAYQRALAEIERTAGISLF